MSVPIVFWGATGQAKVLRSFAADVGYELVAMFDNNPELESPFADVPLFVGAEGFNLWEKNQRHSVVACAVAIGGNRGRDRVAMQSFMADRGLQPVTLVHPRSVVADGIELGPGCQVLASANVCAEVQVGAAGIINTASSVDHESSIGDGVHIGPGATLAGCVTVGDYSMVGAGSVVLPGVRIGSDVVVGAGSVVTRDLPDDIVAFGSPARFRRKNTTRQEAEIDIRYSTK